MTPRNVLMVKLNLLGDTICFLPTIMAMRRNWPRTRLTCLTTNVGKAVIECTKLVDEIWVADINEIKAISGFMKWLRIIKDGQFDLAVASSDSSSYVALLLFLSSIPMRVGYTNPKLSFLYNSRIQFTNHIPHTLLNLQIATQLGLSVVGINLPMAISTPEVDKNNTDELLVQHGITKNDRFIVLHVGANKPSRRWPIDKFSEVVNALAVKHDVQFVCVGGNQEEALVSLLSNLTKEAHLINLCGKTSIRQLIYIISLSELFVGHSSGPLHIAFMLGVPTVSLWGASSLAIWGPIWEKEKHMCIRSNMDCQGCEMETCPRGNLECMDNINVNEVITAIENAMLRNSKRSIRYNLA